MNIKITMTSMLIIFSSVCISQVKEKWNTSLQGSANWQQVTPAGHLLIGTSSALTAVAPETGKIQWELTRFGGITQDGVQQVGSSPLVSVNNNGDIFMIDPFSGEIKFDSQKAGIVEILDDYVLYKTNGILIAGKDASNKPAMVFANLADGKIAWKLSDDYGRVVSVNELNSNELLIVTLFNNYKINSKSGEIIWKNDVSEANKQLEKLGAFGGLMKQVATQQAEGMDFNVKFYKHPMMDVFYVGSEQKKESSISSSSSTPVTYSSVFYAYNMSDGARLWEKPLEVNGRLSQLYFHGRDLVILPDDGSNTKINLYNHKNQESSWGKKGRGIKVKGGIYDYVAVGNGLLLISKNGDRNYLTFLDLNLGILTFEKPVKIDGEVVRTEKIGNGVFFVTTEEANVLNTSSGELLLDSSIPTSPSLVGSIEDKFFIFDTKNDKLKVLNKANSSVSDLSGVELKFEGKESPTGLEVRDNGIFIHSDQNVALFDLSGSLTYQNYYEAPREPGLKRALLYAQAVRAAYIGASAYAASGAYQSAAPQVKQEDALAGAMVEGIGQAYGELGDAASDFAKKSFKQASARFKASTQARDFMVILSKQEGNKNALLKVNKNTGKADAYIDLGKEKKPNYAVDDVTGQVFYQTGSSTIAGYQLD
ncbi:PQQ-binding-like beta-propeller repeat protein [Fulvivirga sp. 29W222]|uniref:PQQ-binding-like beta-propeller repeat protein n=1 Tax=Fulvivirga marina TaxID=2494733 RepID=A0A937KAX3_9BACT|nr:PQQ-binding-like beta-propeller repeat protein [Fulvivirga marina]MBL6445217.1 PQQ-binding-like beta-propeller repeat protein [Fulvivirga marina]